MNTKQPSLLLTLALALGADALPSRGRIPDILADIRRRKEQGQTEERPELLRAGGPRFAGGGGTDADGAGSDVETLTFDQRLDHFSKEEDGDAATFPQRYFYASRFAADSESESDGGAATERNRKEEEGEKKTLAFLCVGGEGPSLDPSVLVDSVHCTGDMIGLAEKLHKESGADVHLFALEHRFYGESFPDQSQGENQDRAKGGVLLRGAEGEGEDEGEDEAFEVDLTHLSSRQAVRDIVAFVRSPEVAAKMNRDGATWIAFGGSYPGMLSAWSRLLHPSAIFAAVSNSAPVQARLDFREYNEAAGTDLADPLVGGSDECREVFAEGHEQAAKALSDGALERVADMFNVCGGAKQLGASKRNMDIFVGDGLLRVPAQSNDPACDGGLCNIEKLCDAITGERKSNPDVSSMEVLANVKKTQQELDGESCDSVDWQSYLDWFSVPTKQNANSRSWMYQTCTEFGFYQTCNEDSRCPYGKGYHDVSQDLEFCRAVFGIDPDDVRANVAATLAYYGGWSLAPDASARTVPHSVLEGVDGGGGGEAGGKRLLFVTGTVDPWTALAVTGGRANADHPSVSVEGASHHFWTHEVKDSDGAAIREARETIYGTVEGWLGLEAGIVATE